MAAGIGDAALGLTDTVLHFAYNAVVTLAILVPFWFFVRSRMDAPATSELIVYNPLRE